MTLKLKPTAIAAALSIPAARTAGIPDALAHFDSLPDAAFVRLPVVEALHDVGPATIWRWSKSGRLPAPVKIGPNTTAWNVGSLRRAMAKAGA